MNPFYLASTLSLLPNHPGCLARIVQAVKAALVFKCIHGRPKAFIFFTVELFLLDQPLKGRLNQFVTNPALRRLIDRLADDTGAITIGGRPWRLADVDSADLLDEIRRRGGLPDFFF